MQHKPSRRVKINGVPKDVHAYVKLAAYKADITIMRYVTDLTLRAMDTYPEHLKQECSPYKSDNDHVLDVRCFPAEKKQQLITLCKNLGVSMNDFILTHMFKK